MPKYRLIPALFAAAAISSIVLQPAVSAEEECPKEGVTKAGTFEATVTTVGFIAGARWGEGMITLNDGSEHKIHLEGAKLLEYGAEKVTLTGEVLNLNRLEDFPGDYGALGGGITIGTVGVGGVTLSNDNCVYINAKAEAEGLRLSAPAPGGVLISFEE